MIPLGLTAAKQNTLHASLATHHSIHVTVQLLTLSGSRLGDLSSRLLDGQVNIDALAEVTRSCTLDLLDPDRSLHFDSDSPNDGAIYADRMVQVNYSVKTVEATPSWVTVPLFTGPIVKMDRTDDVVHIEAHGKDALAMGAAWIPATYRKGMRKVDVVQEILAAAGETKFSFLVSSLHRLPGDYSLSRETVPWSAAKAVAHSMGAQLFYDGRGVARMRYYPAVANFDFRTGDGGLVTSPPQVAYSIEDLKNVIWVRGGVPKGSTQIGLVGGPPAPRPPTVPGPSIHAVAYLPYSHPLSTVRLGRNGKQRFLLEVIDNSAIVSQTEANNLARTTLNQRVLEAVEVSFDALPAPHLEPYDVARLVTDEFANAFRVKQLSIPLVTGKAMSVGYLNRISANPRRIRR